ncbi:hypothetical protein SBX64_17065 [Vibrio rhizosphaerae]|uniref:Uncharacterized protein n=2 Tax=Vibrio TaxID=662 RepID=A0A1R4LBD0_VIBR1|nr:MULTISPECIES: hypothetical protein [Vibrio]MDW6094252.1 hypothetical protein [Vibrio rhizosphaerae]SJN53719.1 hypothetical protein VR7878_00463 [Vibrio ruber DSM 16370]
MNISDALKKHAPQMQKMYNHPVFSALASDSNQAILPDVYKANVAAVNSCVSRVLDSQLPTLQLPPDNWSEFCQTYTEAQSDALIWVNQVVARLDNVPEDVQSYNGDVMALLKDAMDMAKCMINYPARRTMYVSMLNQDLTMVTKKLDMVLGFVQGTVDALKNFQNILPEMAQKLQNLANMASKEEGVDQKKIAELKDDIANLNKEIDSLTAAIVALGIADAAAIALGTLATVVAFPVGAVAWLFCAPAIAVATTYIVLDAEKIKADKAKIEAKEGEMDKRTQDVATLHLLAQTFQQLADSSKEVQDNLEQIVQNWNGLVNDLSGSIADVQKAALDCENCDDQAIVDDLEQAITCWNDAYGDAGNLTIELNHSDANIELGMNQEQVEKAYKSSNVVDMVTYFNEYSHTAKSQKK